MRHHAGKFVILFCIGIAIGWFGHERFGDVQGQRAPVDQASARVAGSDPSAGSANLGPSVAAAPTSPATRMKSEPAGVKADTPSVAPSQNFNSSDKAISATPITRDTPKDASDAGTTGKKENPSDSQAATATPAGTLLKAGAVKCDFSQGNGGFWQNQALTLGTAAWQGGPIVYDSINIAAGTARMIGPVILTGSVTEPANVTAASTSTALHLYGVASNGTLTSTTIFGAARNPAGHYNAVISYHGPNIHNDQESAQFYGTCNTTG